MLKLMMAILLTTTFTAHAKRILVADLDGASFRTSDQFDSRFFFNTTSGEGSVDIDVTRVQSLPETVCTGGGPIGTGSYCRIQMRNFYTTLLKTLVSIPDLRLEGNTATYYSPDGAVVCGTMKISRYLNIRTFYLSGNCSFEENLVKVDGKNRLQVYFITK